jgi:hypothetical protein
MEKREIRELVIAAEKGDEDAKRKLKELARSAGATAAAEHRLDLTRLAETR